MLIRIRLTLENEHQLVAGARLKVKQKDSLRLGDAEIMATSHNVELGRLYEIRTFVWQNTYKMTIRELQEFFYEAAIGTRESSLTPALTN